MQVHTSIQQLPSFTNAVVTIGTFDGVHKGHQKIISKLKQEAAAVKGETVIITFHPHPRKVVAGKEIELLNTLPEKIFLLNKFYIDHLVIVPFDESFSNQTAEEYITDFLVQNFHPHTIIIGYDHKFGKGRSGDYHLLEDYGKKLGFTVKEIDEQILNEVIISSTKIRSALLSGDLETAHQCLGYAYFFEGIVADGNKLGRTLGYPTANILTGDRDKLIPANGVYVVQCKLDDDVRILQGMMSIGVRPTIGGGMRTIEVNLFNFDEDIYGKLLRVSVMKYLRAEEKYNSLDEMVRQIDKDKEESLQYFNSSHNIYNNQPGLHM